MERIDSFTTMPTAWGGVENSTPRTPADVVPLNIFMFLVASWWPPGGSPGLFTAAEFPEASARGRILEEFRSSLSLAHAVVYCFNGLPVCWTDFVANETCWN